ncbi:MAG TPA: hypothetical protein VFA71_00440 [Terriglobales bacterium]|nr:hypothetical protein [Terriglobales bacterium]
MEGKDVLVRYLLGDLFPSDRERLEKQLSVDDQAREALAEAENDLIDSYTCGELSAKQRQQFEENFLNSSQRNDQLAVAQMLMDHAVREKITAAPIREQKGPISWRESAAAFLFGKHFAMRLALATAALALAAAGFLAVENWRLRNEVNMAHLEQPRLQRQLNYLEQQANATSATGSNTQNQDHSQTAKLEEPPLSQVSILLSPHLSRQQVSRNPNNRLVIPDGTHMVTLKLDLEQDAHRQYDVVVETVDGTAIQHIERLTSQGTGNGGRCVAVQLSSRQMSRGDYVVTLYGREANGELPVVDSYSLSVVRR